MTIQTMQQKSKKTLTLLLTAILLCFSLLFVIHGTTHHLEHCETHCQVCTTLDHIQKGLRAMGLFRSVTFKAGFLLFFFTCPLQQTKEAKTDTLVSLKVKLSN